MWTKAHRARHDARLKAVVSLHAVGEVARWLERADPPRSARATPYAAVVRGLAWHLRVGGAWRALPSGLVHWRTACGWLRRWLALGLFEALLRQVAGLRRRAVERDPAQKGFVVLERRWVVERSFGWLVHWGGLLRDRAGRLDVSAARVAFAAVLSGVEALINPKPIQAAAS